jgi:hypothetical protein
VSPAAGPRRRYDQRRGEHRTTLSISTDASVIRRFKALAKERGQSVSEIGRDALTRYLQAIDVVQDAAALDEAVRDAVSTPAYRSH